MAKLSIPLLFLLAAASSAATVPAHRRSLPPRFKMVRGVDRRRRRRDGGRQDGVRVHGVHQDGVDLEGGDELEHHSGAGRRGRERGGDHGPAVVGRADEGGPLLLRAREPRHLQRPRAVHGRRLRRAAVLDARVVRRHGAAPRVVLQLRRGHRHGASQGVRAAAVHRRAVARHRRPALQARGRPRHVLPLRRRRGVSDARGRRGVARSGGNKLCSVRVAVAGRSRDVDVLATCRIIGSLVICGEWHL